MLRQTLEKIRLRTSARSLPDIGEIHAVVYGSARILARCSWYSAGLIWSFL
jgi:hypothetical protein